MMIQGPASDIAQVSQQLILQVLMDTNFSGSN